jgi:hypothetical protein
MNMGDPEHEKLLIWDSNGGYYSENSDDDQVKMRTAFRQERR